MARKKKVLMVFSSPYNRPRDYDYSSELADPDDLYTEKDVLGALQSCGYAVRLLGIHNDLTPLFEEVKEFPPDCIFNLVEVYDNQSRYEKNMAALFEMLRIPFTGATSDNLHLCNDKALHRKIFQYHRLKNPGFQIFHRGHKVWLPRRLKLPCIIKPTTEEASRGISQASIVDNEEAFMERVKFIHEKVDCDAIAEEYIEGREFYVSVFGSKQLTVLPPREMIFGELPEDQRIASYKAKWDDDYRDKWGIKSGHASRLSDVAWQNIQDVCKRAYRALNIKSYLRFDVRLTPSNDVYIIEPNANPCIARIDEVALSAQKAGISYQQLIKKIVNLSFKSN